MTLGAFQILAALIFVIGGIGLYRQRADMLRVGISILVMALGAVLSLGAAAHFAGDGAGRVLIAFALVALVAQAGVGLAIGIAFWRSRGSIRLDDIKGLKG